MNFIFISPHFPDNYWLFCQGLKKHGVNVLGIADAPYDSLPQHLKDNLTEYYRVNSMENYDEMLRAVAYFTHHYGKIDWIESNNEYWLRQDARLRKDFNITTGISYDEIDFMQRKSFMKEIYAKHGIKHARYQLVTTYEDALSFIPKVGYPIIIKPDVGVGSSDTHKINNQEELQAYFKHPRLVDMIMEEYVDGDCYSFDGITNANKDILFMTSHQYTSSIMESVNNHKTIGCYSYRHLEDDAINAGLRSVLAFNTRSRFFHFEFFRLRHDQEGLGCAGDVVGLEVNMRPPGGFIPDLINYACDIDSYQLWADMICDDRIHTKVKRKYSCGFVGRRDCIHYAHPLDDIKAKYQTEIQTIKRLPKALAEGMGDEIIIARFDSEDAFKIFFDYCAEEYVTPTDEEDTKTETKQD